MLDGIFNQDINGVVGGGGNTTDTYRYATLNGVHLALPTAGVVPTAPSGLGAISVIEFGTAVGSSPRLAGSNAVNSTYNDYLAIWDAYNGVETDWGPSGIPLGWAGGGHWSATPTMTGHALVSNYQGI